MKRNLFLLSLCLLVVSTSQVYAADTYTESLLENVHQKINKTASPVLEQERKINAQQKKAQELKQIQISERQKQIEANQKAQQDLVNKKRQQIQNQKDMFNQQKKEIKNLFSVQ